MTQWNWAGKSGQVYLFTSYSIADVTWNDIAGVYIFAKEGIGAQFQPVATPLYIGQAGSFRDRIANHERYAEARRQGMTHIHATVLSLQERRSTVEADLIARWQPPMNALLKSPSLADILRR